MYLCVRMCVLVLVHLAPALPLLSLATSGRIRASVLSTRSSSPSCSVAEAVLKLGKKKASSLLAWSMSSLPCTALNSVCVPYCARKLQEAGGERGEESRWLLGWCSTREKHNVWVCLTERARMCCSLASPRLQMVSHCCNQQCTNSVDAVNKVFAGTGLVQHLTAVMPPLMISPSLNTTPSTTNLSGFSLLASSMSAGPMNSRHAGTTLAEPSA